MGKKNEDYYVLSLIKRVVNILFMNRKPTKSKNRLRQNQKIYST